jgi:hypothetical protein
MNGTTKLQYFKYPREHQLNFIALIEQSVYDDDRFFLRLLDKGAHGMPLVQEAIRWADTYLLACKSGNVVVKDIAIGLYDNAVAKIRGSNG